MITGFILPSLYKQIKHKKTAESHMDSAI